MAVNFNVPAVRSSFITFTSILLVPCEFLQLVFFPTSFILLIFQTQELRNTLVIPTNQPPLHCLGPMGDPDPTDLINAEANRIPFKAQNFSLNIIYQREIGLAIFVVSLLMQK
jgi:hypothetical protein